jgi:hypothetical protein
VAVGDSERSQCVALVLTVVVTGVAQRLRVEIINVLYIMFVSVKAAITLVIEKNGVVYLRDDFAGFVNKLKCLAHKSLI